jgi:hypothetical protein
MVDSKTRLALAAGAVVIIGAGLAFFFLHRSQPAAAPQPAAALQPVAASAQAKLPAPADCLFPGPPPIPPNGLTASADDMKLGRNVIQHFVEELEAYQACRNTQIDRAGKTLSDKQKETWIEQGNTAIDEATALKDAFSAQREIFNSRTAPQQ